MTEIIAAFPGQGAQQVGMLAGFGCRISRSSATFAEASTALNFDLWDMVQNGSAETLNLT